MYVVDTNIVSELVKATPDARVLSWLTAHERDLYLTAITVEEMRFGALCLPEGKRKRTLSSAIDEIVTTYAHRTLPFDIAAAEVCARYHRQAIASGFTPTIEDLMIAAICTCSGASLATRNVHDFDYLDIEVVNPFGVEMEPPFD